MCLTAFTRDTRLRQHARPLQREVITATLEGEDVFLQAATSFGKSLCYQLPAVVDFGSALLYTPCAFFADPESDHRHIPAVGPDGKSRICT